MIIDEVDQILQLSFHSTSQDFQCLWAAVSLSVSSLSVTSNRNATLKNTLAHLLLAAWREWVCYDHLNACCNILNYVTALKLVPMGWFVFIYYISENCLVRHYLINYTTYYLF